MQALVAGAAEVIATVDIGRHEGAHPRVGALDVAPIVHLTPADRGAACAAALTLADRLGSELDLPVFLYGALTQNARTRADIRRGGSDGLALRIQTGEVSADFGPRAPHPTAGATMVAARPPLVAFNVELAPPADLDTARRIAASIRQGGPEGLTGVRAIAVSLTSRSHVPQVSTNVENHLATSLADVVERDLQVRHSRSVPNSSDLAPARAFDDFPEGARGGQSTHDRGRARTVRDGVSDYRLTTYARHRLEPVSRTSARVRRRRTFAEASSSAVRRGAATPSPAAFSPRSVRRSPVKYLGLETGSKVLLNDGADQAQTADQAPRQRRRHDRGARPHRSPAERRREEEASRATGARRAAQTASRPGQGSAKRALLAGAVHVRLPLT